MKTILMITLLFFSYGIVNADILKATGKVTIDYYPGNKSIEDIFRYYENMNNKFEKEGLANDNKLFIAQMNTENILNTGVSNTFPFILHVNFSADNQFIEKYKIEYIPSILETSDPLSSPTEPVFSNKLKVTIIADILNNKKTIERYDLANNIKDVLQLDGVFNNVEAPEEILFLYNTIQEMKKMEPLSTLSENDRITEEYIYNNEKCNVITEINSGDVEILNSNDYYKIVMHHRYKMPKQLIKQKTDEYHNIELTSFDILLNEDIESLFSTSQ